ncbi:MAG: phage holin family protein [Catalinimonas sp.]
MKNNNRLYRFLKVDSLLENLVGYVEARIELTKIQIQEKLEGAASGASSVPRFIALAFFGIFALSFLSMALATLLNWAIGTPTGGYWIVFGLYALICILLATVLAKPIDGAVYKVLAKALKLPPEPEDPNKPTTDYHPNELDPATRVVKPDTHEVESR